MTAPSRAIEIGGCKFHASRGLEWTVIGLAVVGLGGCNPAPPPLSPKAMAVQVLKADPPPGSTDLGAITAYDGIGCGPLSDDGTFEGALARIRNDAAARGGNYVEMVAITEPHFQDNCQNHTFTIVGRLFRVKAKAAQQTSEVAACDPPCSPGYACDSGACEPAPCNPACEAGYACESGACKALCNRPARTEWSAGKIAPAAPSRFLRSRANGSDGVQPVTAGTRRCDAVMRVGGHPWSRREGSAPVHEGDV